MWKLKKSAAAPRQQHRLLLYLSLIHISLARFKRTLIVEQSRKYVVQIKDMLADVSDSFLSTTDGSEAIALYDQYNPDLVLVEAIMPGYDGFALMEHTLATDII